MLESKDDGKYCAFCGNQSKLSCARCRFETYCSQKCQIEDFPNHRYICFPLPDLIPIEHDDTTSIIDNEKLDEQNKIQLEETEANESVLNEVKNDGLEQQSDTIRDSYELKQNDTVIGTISITSSFEADNYEEDVTETITDVMQSLEFTENLKNLQITQELSEIKEVPSSNQVVPLKQACHDVIAKKTGKFFTMNDLKIHEWPKGKNVKVKLLTIVQQPNVMSFVEDKIIIEQFYQFMESEIKKYRPCISKDFYNYLPKKNEIVLGHYNGSWYRAFVLDSDPKGVIVLFIDYGNMELLLTNEILPISNEYYIDKMSFEVCSRQFIVDNVPAELDEKQQEILDSGHMMITNIHVDDKGLTHCEIFGF